MVCLANFQTLHIKSHYIVILFAKLRNEKYFCL